MADLQRILGEEETEQELAQMAENFDIKTYLESRRQIVEEGLEYYVNHFGGETSVAQAIRYSMFAKSKRIRPILCFAACEAFGGDTRQALPAACALEMIHTYTLIHDDLPAMDDDDMRRGQAACHVKFNDATAILAGDALLSMAFEILGSNYVTCDALVDAKRWLRIISILGQGAGPRGVVGGQIMDMESIYTKLDLKQLEELSYRKTSIMMVTPLEIGAVLAYASEIDIMKMYEFGKYMGLAFQAMDDVLDIEEDREFVENQSQSDKPVVKNTFALLLGEKEARDLALEYTEKALAVLDGYGSKFDPLRELTRFLVNREG